MSPNNIFLSFLICSFFLGSCTSDNAFEKVFPINNQWKKDDAKVVHLKINDTKTPYHLSFVLRNNNEYAFSNIFLFAELETPSKKKIVDTLEYKLASPDGKWLGTGMGSIKENYFTTRKKFSFSEKGNYTLKIKQGMRKNNLSGIEDFTVILTRK